MTADEKMQDSIWHQRITGMFQEQQRNGEPDGPIPQNPQKMFWNYQRKKFNKMFDEVVGTRFYSSNATKNLATTAFALAVFASVYGYIAESEPLVLAFIWSGINFLTAAYVHLNIFHYRRRRAHWLMASSDPDFVDIVKVEVTKEDESKFTITTTAKRYTEDTYIYKA